MHVSLTTTRGLLGEPIEIATIAGEEMYPWLRQIDGFKGLVMLSNEENGTTLVLTFWESREVAERHLTSRMAMRDRVTAAVNVEVEETVGYEVTFIDLDSDVTD